MTAPELDFAGLRREREELCELHADLTGALERDRAELQASGDTDALTVLEEVEREMWERLLEVERLLRIN